MLGPAASLGSPSSGAAPKCAPPAVFITLREEVCPLIGC